LTRTESPPPDAVSLIPTAAEATWSCRREVDAEEVEREREEVEASDELFHENETERGEEKRVQWRGAEATPTAAAAVASSMAAARSEAKQRGCVGDKTRRGD
jgi:hypothetical protein